MTTADTATTDHDGRPAPAVEMTHRQILAIMGGLMMALLLAALDQTIVASAMRVVADDLHGLSMQAWATTAYLITATITTPLYGKLSDLYGRKPLLLIAMAVFLLGSVLSGLSQSMYELAAFRAVQGLGAGGLFSLVLATIGDIVSPRERARYQGYYLAVFGTSSVLGPVVGGFFAGSSDILGFTGWRWVFLINLPLGLAAMAVVSKVLQLPHQRREHRIDWPGAVALSIGLVPLLIVAEQGRGWGWTSDRTLTLIGIGVLGLIAFVLAERRIGDDALIPLKHFRSPTFRVANGAGLVIGMAMFGGFASLPLYLQIVKGASPTKAGLMLLPLTIGVMAGSAASGQVISRTGRYKMFPVVGSALMVVGLLLFSRVGWDTPMWQIGVYMLVFGLGLGGNMQTLMLAVQASLPPSEMGVATSSATFSRQMGGTLGTAVFLSILFSTVGDKIGNAFRTIAPTAEFQSALHDPAVLADPANQPVLAALQSGGGLSGVSIDDSSFINHLDPRLAQPFLAGFSDSMDLVFLVAAGVTVIAFALVVFLKEIPLPTQSGIVARQQAAAEAAAGE
jgi:EmrB/QacA subfamily drug resistance transporter